MKRETLKRILDKYSVQIVYVFGSRKDAGLAFLEGNAGTIEAGSDLDVGVVFETLPHDTFTVYGELYADLSVFFEPFTIDLVFLQETGVLFQFEAVRGHVVYSKDETFLDEYEEMVMKMASDLSFKKAEFERDFLEAVKNGYFEIARR